MCDVEVMHEWTGGCFAQYNSGHCMDDVSLSNADFGYRTIRNYFETSHAKGPAKMPTLFLLGKQFSWRRKPYSKTE